MKKMFSIIMALIIMSVFSLMPATAANTNLALGKTAVCESPDPGVVASNEGLVFFSSAYLTDGDIPIWDGASAVPICWYGGSPTRDTTLTITIDLEDTYAINQIALAPASFLDGQNFPSDYQVHVSKDNSTWVKIGEESDLSGVRTAKSVHNTTQDARYVRVTITKMSTVADASFYYAGIAEIEVFGGPIENPETGDSAMLVSVIVALMLALGAYVSMRQRKNANVF